MNEELEEGELKYTFMNFEVKWKIKARSARSATKGLAVYFVNKSSPRLCIL